MAIPALECHGPVTGRVRVFSTLRTGLNYRMARQIRRLSSRHGRDARHGHRRGQDHGPLHPRVLEYSATRARWSDLAGSRASKPSAEAALMEHKMDPGAWQTPTRPDRRHGTRNLQFGTPSRDPGHRDL
jgi:hypothetical protein